MSQGGCPRVPSTIYCDIRCAGLWRVSPSSGEILLCVHLHSFLEKGLLSIVGAKPIGEGTEGTARRAPGKEGRSFTSCHRHGWTPDSVRLHDLGGRPHICDRMLPVLDWKGLPSVLTAATSGGGHFGSGSMAFSDPGEVTGGTWRVRALPVTPF